MTPEIERLLGGYATNTLSPEERKLLYEAALEDQHLFNALEDEQALRDLLTDVESRREILRALRSEPKKPSSKKPSRLWIWGLAASVALATVLLLVMIPREAPKPLSEAFKQKTTAALSVPEPAAAPPPASPIKATPVPIPRKKDKIEPSAPAPAAPPPPPSARAVAQVNVVAAAPVQDLARLATEADALKAKQVSGRNQFLQTGGALRAPRMMASFFVIQKTGPDGTTTDLPPSEIIPAGSSILLKLRPGLPGTLALWEVAADGSSTTLPPDAPIVVDRQKAIRVEWLNPSDANRATTLLNLSPDKPPEQH
jgi:hypothetical protein